MSAKSPAAGAGSRGGAGASAGVGAAGRGAVGARREWEVGAIMAASKEHPRDAAKAEARANWVMGMVMVMFIVTKSAVCGLNIRTKSAVVNNKVSKKCVSCIFFVTFCAIKLVKRTICAILKPCPSKILRSK